MSLIPVDSTKSGNVKEDAKTEDGNVSSYPVHPNSTKTYDHPNMRDSVALQRAKRDFESPLKPAYSTPIIGGK